MSTYSSWLDMFSDSSFADPLNFESVSLANLLDSGVLKQCIQSTKENEGLLALTLDPMSNEVFLVHNFTQLGGTIRRKESLLVDIVEGIELIEHNEIVDSDHRGHLTDLNLEMCFEEDFNKEQEIEQRLLNPNKRTHRKKIC